MADEKLDTNTLSTQGANKMNTPMFNAKGRALPKPVHRTSRSSNSSDFKNILDGRPSIE